MSRGLGDVYKRQIENTVKKIFGDGIILNFSTKQLNKSNPTNTPIINQNEKKNLKPIKKMEPKTNLSTKRSNEKNYNRKCCKKNIWRSNNT